MLKKISIHIFQESQINDLLIWALIFQSFKSFNQYFFTYFKNYENELGHLPIYLFSKA